MYLILYPLSLPITVPSPSLDPPGTSSSIPSLFLSPSHLPPSIHLVPHPLSPLSSYHRPISLPRSTWHLILYPLSLPITVPSPSLAPPGTSSSIPSLFLSPSHLPPSLHLAPHPLSPLSSYHRPISLPRSTWHLILYPLSLPITVPSPSLAPPGTSSSIPSLFLSPSHLPPSLHLAPHPLSPLSSYHRPISLPRSTWHLILYPLSLPITVPSPSLAPPGTSSSIPSLFLSPSHLPPSLHLAWISGGTSCLSANLY
ncbi:hypothetical protein NHX12_030211 [Muraenolepis orangiensis]|uniref:Uncharacterized protein n=1 Tax=Muraenolepis orangiensis TaxID=630683 RepID=A0A9Q0IMK1_9TELE|nr:hypothetical protein NHX12_030211 [Muraenolepis orangiensis]